MGFLWALFLWVCGAHTFARVVGGLLLGLRALLLGLRLGLLGLRLWALLLGLWAGLVGGWAWRSCGLVGAFSGLEALGALCRRFCWVCGLAGLVRAFAGLVGC